MVGFLAGWGFVVGKTASCAAMALTFAAYAVPPAWQRPVAVAAVVVLAAVNYRGVTRTAGLSRIIVGVVLAALAVVVAACLAGGQADLARLSDDVTPERGVYGVLQSAGLLFFAFASYARIATMGEEVRNPQRTIPRAITLALGITVAVYAIVGASGRRGVADDGPQRRPAPFAGSGAPALRGPAPCRDRSCRRRVSVLVLTVDLRGAIGFSSFGVLLYYLIANLSAFTQHPDQRRFPRWLQVLRAGGCVLLVVTLPWTSVLAGLAVFAVGIAYRAWRLRRAAST